MTRLAAITEYRSSAENVPPRLDPDCVKLHGYASPVIEDNKRRRKLELPLGPTALSVQDEDPENAMMLEKGRLL